MQQMIVSVPDAKDEQLNRIHEALISAGLNREFEITVSSKGISVLNMEEEVYLFAENNGYQIDAYEEKLDQIAYNIVMEDESFNESLNIALQDGLRDSNIPYMETEASEAPMYVGVTSQNKYPLTREQIPHFIMNFGHNEGLRIVDQLDKVVLTTLPGPFLDRVLDRNMHAELLRTLIPMQQGKIQPISYWSEEAE